MGLVDIRQRRSKCLLPRYSVLLLLCDVFSQNSAASAVVSLELSDYNNDGLQSDMSFGSSPVAPPTGDSVNTFGLTGETGCVNASDGDTCDPIIFDSGTIGTSVFTSGFNLNGAGVVLPKTTGSVSADVTEGVLTFSSLPFALFQPDPSVDIEVFLPPGSFAVFGSSLNVSPDFSYLMVEDLTSLGNGQYGVIVSWLHQGPSCLGCFNSIDARILLEGVMTVVPLPAAVWLFGSGLIVVIGVARRRA